MRKLLFITITLVTIFVSCRKTTTPTNPTNTTQPPTDSIFEGQMGVFNLGTGNTFATTTDTAAWHYIAVTKAANLAGQIYLDGQLVADTVFQNKVYNYSTIYLAASNYTSFTGFYNGYLDEFRVSNTVRTAQEIQAYYASNAPFSSDSNTIGLWHFDETNGSITFANAVGSNGTLTNNPQFVSGKFGNAVYFNGTNQYGNCNLSIPSSNITLEFWYKTSVPQATTLVQPYGTNSTNIYYTTKKVAQQNAPTTLSNGLIAYYPFSGNAKDSTSNHLDGIVSGATLISDRFGNANSAYSFNMNTDTSDHVDIANSTILEPNSSLSISAWVWISDLGNTNFQRIVSKQYTQPQSYASYQLIAGNEIQDSLGYAGLTLRTSTSYNWTGHSGISLLNQWVHMCGTWDGTNMKFYQNGDLTATIPQGGKILYDNEDLLIGKGFDGLGNNQYFKGYIDEVRIYNRALNQQEITYLATH